MPRYWLTIEYDGAPFVGWQRQINGNSVQESVERAVFSFSGEEVNAFAAGRTDAGVHALGMSAHFDLSKDFPADVVCNALNFHLKPAPIAILNAKCVDEDFHARFSCTARHYEYRIINRRPPLTLLKNHAWRVPAELDIAAMNEGAQFLIGRHDFTTFRAASCQSASPVKTLNAITVDKDQDRVFVRCSAPSFLHNQVRSFVGTLVEVGLGKWAPTGVKDALEAKDRSRCGQTAPAHGLYFVRADYDTN